MNALRCFQMPATQNSALFLNRDIVRFFVVQSKVFSHINTFNYKQEIIIKTWRNLRPQLKSEKRRPNLVQNTQTQLN